MMLLRFQREKMLKNYLRVLPNFKELPKPLFLFQKDCQKLRLEWWTKFPLTSNPSPKKQGSRFLLKNKQDITVILTIQKILIGSTQILSVHISKKWRVILAIMFLKNCKLYLTNTQKEQNNIYEQKGRECLMPRHLMLLALLITMFQELEKPTVLLKRRQKNLMSLRENLNLK